MRGLGRGGKVVLTMQTKEKSLGNSLAVQWLGLSTFTAAAWVQSLVGEVRSRKLFSEAKKKKKKKKERNH